MPNTGSLAPTPPMGWNSWNAYSCAVAEADVREAADALVETGLRDAGYEYVVVDDCWMADELDADGGLRADPDDFPSGMAALADYVHDRGLKFGLYSSAGSHTCQGYPASLGRERCHAEQFADWGVDYLKYDNCGDHGGRGAVDRYQAMGDALAALDRDIVYSVCEWGKHRPWEWGNDVGAHLWRATDDVVAKWRTHDDEFGLGIRDILNRMADPEVGAEHGPHGWNDPDMLQVGNGPDSGQSQHEPTDVRRPLTDAETRTHFGMWCLLGAPLLVGTALRDLPETDREILTNERLLEIDQDPLGAQGRPVRRDIDAEVWHKPLQDGGVAVALCNTGEEAREIRTDLGRVDSSPDTGSYRVCDCWSGERWETDTTLAAGVDPRDTAVFRVTPG